jgi:phospholipid-binding lipoprotein MlaA
MRSQKISLVIVLLASLLGGCATNGDPGDPLEPLNRGITKFNDAFDAAIAKPVATGYKAALPQPVRTGVGNFFSNLDDVIVLLNDLLQFKFGQAASDFGRLVFNTTLGIAGIFDVSTPMQMPKHNEDFGQTLGRWGIGPGPYLVLPFFGPSDLRDTVGLVVDYRVDPVYQQDDMAVRNTAVVLRAIHKRSVLLGTEDVVNEAALDPYIFVRNAYLQRRNSLVHDGQVPDEE